jgi:hypothetical protein
MEEPEFTCSCGARLRADEVEAHARGHGLKGEGDVAATLRRLADSAPTADERDMTRRPGDLS